MIDYLSNRHGIRNNENIGRPTATNMKDNALPALYSAAGPGDGAEVSHVLIGGSEALKGSSGHSVGSGRSSRAAPRALSLKKRPMRAVLLRGTWLLSEGLP